jgi:Asp-tRNA(Asn)/Glu-tRNA(Gln) amidotransferase A subunit family amidase
MFGFEPILILFLVLIASFFAIYKMFVKLTYEQAGHEDARKELKKCQETVDYLKAESAQVIESVLREIVISMSENYYQQQSLIDAIRQKHATQLYKALKEGKIDEKGKNKAERRLERALSRYIDYVENSRRDIDDELKEIIVDRLKYLKSMMI